MVNGAVIGVFCIPQCDTLSSIIDGRNTGAKGAPRFLDYDTDALHMHTIK